MKDWKEQLKLIQVRKVEPKKCPVCGRELFKDWGCCEYLQRQKKTHILRKGVK